MSTVKEHYDNHLGDFYSWMIGDFDSRKNDFKAFLNLHDIKPRHSGIALDLGAGNGIQSVALAQSGFHVKAIDFNDQLLNDLRQNSNGLSVDVIKNDMRNVDSYKYLSPDVIVCCGDTLTHLDNKNDVLCFINNIYVALSSGGRLILSFRDYSKALTGDERFIPVKSSEEKILTCFLEYTDDFVMVTDLLYQHTSSGWQQKISSYKKVRLSVSDIISALEQNTMKIIYGDLFNGMQTIIAAKR